MTTPSQHPQRCETCTKQLCHFHPNNNYWKNLSNGYLHFFYDATNLLGCASHSDFQSERDKMLDILDEWLNSDDHLSLYKWEVREKIRELRQAGSP